MFQTKYTFNNVKNTNVTGNIRKIIYDFIIYDETANSNIISKNDIHKCFQQS